jgi:hypothetical protein
MDSEQTVVDNWLDRAVDEFDSNPLCAYLMRRLALERSERFTNSALRYLGSAGQSAALRFMASLLLRQNSIFQRLSDPGPIAMERAHVVFGRLIALDPSFDVKMAKMLPDRTGINHSVALEGLRAARAIEVLDAGSKGRRLLPVLSHLAESRDPRLRAKAMLFVGRRIQSPGWAEKQLEHKDPRIRANAVESLWGLDTLPARELLHRCVNDSASRVAGNSLIGLYLVGEPGILEEVSSMSAAANERFRATAAWSMGRIGNSLFVPDLTTLVRDEDQLVRGTALRSLIGIRREEAKAAAVAAEEAAHTIAKEAPRVLPVPEVPEAIVYVQVEESGFTPAGSGISGYRP